jgi:hypothetical protein
MASFSGTGTQFKPSSGLATVLAAAEEARHLTPATC